MPLQIRLTGFAALCGAMFAFAVAAGGSPAAAREDFAAWLQEVRREALSQGISAETVDAALLDVRPLPEVLERDRRQPEFTRNFRQYLDGLLSPARIDRGRQMLVLHGPLLQSVSRQYGVPARFIVALWGIESEFGRHTGRYPVVPALATLAFDGRRSAFFRKELLSALKILDEDHVEPAAMLGSWAGAMGQSQFMPSSFLSYAVDFDGDGRRDIWTTAADVFASAANYLAKSGWQETESWGREVRLPKGFDHGMAGLQVAKPLAEWQALGVRPAGGGDLGVKTGTMASLVLPDGDAGPAFLVYENFRVVRRWNPSNFFALAVGLLADRLGGG